MRILCSAALLNPRALLASFLCLTGAILFLLALAVARQPYSDAQITSPPRTAGAHGAVPVHKDGKKLPQAAAQLPAGDVAYRPFVSDLRAVRAVRSSNLRDVAPIDPATVAQFAHPEPVLPKRGPKSGSPAGPVQTKAGEQTSAPAPAGLAIDGVGVGLAGYTPSTNPPDVNGRAGSTQYVQWTNTSFAIFNKATGALEYGPAAGNTLFQSLGGPCASHNDGDPVVSYDILAGRWILSQLAFAVGPGSYSHQCFAVSATSDATGEYYLYDFLTDPVYFVDYPHTGVWPDGYYMSAHVFGGGTGFSAGRLYAFEREKMIYALPARMLSAELGQRYGFLPGDLDSLTPPPPGEPAFVLGPSFTQDDVTDSFRAQVTWGSAPSIVVTSAEVAGGISRAPCVSNATTGERDCVPEPPPATATDYLDNLSFHYMYRLAYRNHGTHQSLVVSGTTAGSATTPPHGSVKWFEFRAATEPSSTSTHPALFQSGTFDPDSSYRWMPSIAMDKDGDIALGYSKSSTTINPGIYLTGRVADNPLNTLGAEVEVKAGEGVQLGGENRWGDYSAMTLDPIDQCTFYYTNEYLKTDGAFNWSTRIASYKFPSCASDAGLWGTVTGTVTAADSGVPVPGITVTLSNGYAGASNQDGTYTILVPAGSYTATAVDSERNCTGASPASVTVVPPGGGSVVQNFIMTGTSELESNGLTIDDSAAGNANGIINRAECIALNLALKNAGCANESAISATLTTTTPGVTIIDANASYPDLAIDQSAANTTPFRIATSDTFVCGTEIMLSFEFTYASGTKTIQFSIPTCAGGPNQQIPLSQLTTSDPTQPDRIGRDGHPGTCAGKVSPGGGFPGTHPYKAYTFTNTSGSPRCYTVTINAELNGPGDIESVAYDQVYDPANINTNYLGDSGIAGFGTTTGQASYSFTAPAGHNFVVVVAATGSATSSPFSGTVSGFVDNTAGPGGCPATVPVLTGAASRLSHGTAGAFDAAMPLDGSGVEPRNGAGSYTAVLHFDRALQSGNASVTSGQGNVSSVSLSGNDMLVNLTGVADQQRLNLTATNVAPVNGTALPSVAITIGFLIGDTTGNGQVNASDIAQTKSQSGQTTTGLNFRNDVTINGAINSSDVGLVKARSGTQLP